MPTSVGLSKKQESSRRISTSASLATLKPLNLWITTRLWKILKEMGVPETTLHVSRKTYVQVKKQQLEPDMEQQTGSKLGKEYNKAVYYHPTYLTYMYSTLYEMLGWLNLKMESRFAKEISKTSDMLMIPL